MVIGTVRKKDQEDHGGERGEAQQKFEIIFMPPRPPGRHIGIDS